MTKLRLKVKQVKSSTLTSGTAFNIWRVYKPEQHDFDGFQLCSDAFDRHTNMKDIIDHLRSIDCDFTADKMVHILS